MNKETKIGDRFIRNATGENLEVTWIGDKNGMMYILCASRNRDWSRPKRESAREYYRIPLVDVDKHMTPVNQIVVITSKTKKPDHTFYSMIWLLYLLVVLFLIASIFN